MSPARDNRLDEIRAAIDRLVSAGKDPTHEQIAAELHVSDASLHAMMRQLFSDGRRVDGPPLLSGEPGARMPEP